MRKLERDPKSSEVAALPHPSGFLSPRSFPQQTWATHLPREPPLVSTTQSQHHAQKLTSRGLCPHRHAEPLPDFDDRTHPMDNPLSASPLPPWSSPGTGSKRLPDTSHQFTPDPSAAGSVPAQRFACLSFRYCLLPALRPAPACSSNGCCSSYACRRGKADDLNRVTIPRERGRKAL